VVALSRKKKPDALYIEAATINSKDD